MRKVVDRNYLERPELREYLDASSRNVAVVVDCLELEMLGGRMSEPFLRSTEIIASYPRQIVLAKQTSVAAALRGKKKGLKKRLTDRKRTRTFGKWSKRREKIKQGDKAFEDWRLEAQKEAQEHLDAILASAASFKDDLETHAERYTDEELRLIRTGGRLTPELSAKLADEIMDFALRFFAASPYHRKLPPAREAPYTFVFRFAVCAYMHTLHWIAAGGAKDRKPEKFRNDMIDVAIAAYATCFDGLLSDDKLANEIHDNADYLLKNWFEREDLMPPRGGQHQPDLMT